MFGRGNNDTHLWQEILHSLTLDTDYHSRLDTLLSTLCQLTELPTGYLYLLDNTGQQFHLERSWTDTTINNGATQTAFYSDDAEYGTEAMLFSPPLNKPYHEETLAESLVSTPIGPLYSIPLYLEANPNSSQQAIGLFQIGPVPNTGVPRQVQRKLDRLRFPLALAAYQAQQKELLREELAVLRARSEVGQRLLGSALEIDRYVSLLLDLGLNATKTEAGFVAIVDPESGQLTIRAQANMPAGFIEQVDLTPETGFFDWSLGLLGGALIMRDIDFAEQFNIRSMLAVPLTENDEALGVFSLVNFESADTFDEHNLTLLESFAQQIKLVIHNGRLFNTFTNQYLETVKGLARSLDARYAYTQNHHQKVSQISTLLARRMNLPPDAVEAITTAALIHDIGMVGIVEVQGGFQADFEHPTIGASLIEALPLHPMVGQAIATHHEWVDGWGFPNGLKGHEISIGGRVLAVAEFMVEMLSGTPLRDPWEQDKLVDELKQRRGNQFDPQIVDLTLSLIESQEIELLHKQTDF